jgi:hypothetical protein
LNELPVQSFLFLPLWICWRGLTSTHFTTDKVNAEVDPKQWIPVVFAISCAVVAARVVYSMRFLNFVEGCIVGILVQTLL